MAGLDELVAGAGAIGEQNQLVETLRRLALQRRQAYSDAAPMAPAAPPQAAPVDPGPFEAAALRQRQSVRPAGGRREGLASYISSNYIPYKVQGLANLPGRVMGSVQGAYRGEDYDPEPVMELVGMMMGVGAKPKGSLGAMSLRETGMARDLRSPTAMGRRTFIAKSDKPGTEPIPVNTFYDPAEKNIHIDWIGGDYSTGPNTLGPGEMRSLFKELRDQFPGARTVSGHRVSGARFHASSTGDVRLRLPGVKPTIEEKGVETFQKALKGSGATQETEAIPLSVLMSNREQWRQRFPQAEGLRARQQETTPWVREY